MGRLSEKSMIISRYANKAVKSGGGAGYRLVLEPMGQFMFHLDLR